MPCVATNPHQYNDAAIIRSNPNATGATPRRGTSLIGSFLLHYRILHPLGSGGMGEVYAAEDSRLNRRVALKILPEDMARDAARLQRFRREAQAVAALNHPNVVTIYAVEEADGVPFLTMEIVEGATLVSLIPSGGLAWREFFKWAIPLVDAISAAHQQGVVHRDIKPANIMIGAGDRLKVLDFGIAKLRSVDAGEAATATATAPHTVIGTAAYMSPEQAEGKSIDARSDIFSLGVVLYEMASGLRPFKGDSAMSVLSSILKDTAPPLSLSRPDGPGELDRIIRRCLAKDPGRRYQTAIDLRNDLEDLQQQRMSGTQAGAAAPAPSRSWARYWPVALAAALAAVAMGGFSAWRDRSASTTPAAIRASFTQLTSQPGIEWFPSLSPDSRWLVYAGDAAGNRDIYLQSVAGQNPINLTKDSLDDDDQPAFSPDGEQIVFRSTRDGGGLFIMGRTGEAVRRLTKVGYNPAWSKDGKQIAFTGFLLDVKPQNTEGQSDLFVVDVEGGEPRRIVEMDSGMPNWSPNGKRIAFGSRRNLAGRRLDIMTAAASGGEPVNVTEDDYVDWNPVWSPDGRYVYYISDRGGSTNIWRVPVDQDTGRPLGEPEAITTPASFAAHLTVSGDGRRLAYSSILETQNLHKIELDPERDRLVSQPIPITTGSRFWANPDPSPDGEFVVAYSQVNPEGDLYVFRTDGSGTMRQLTDGTPIDRVPRWSTDGKWIATFSDREGSLQVWKIRPDGSDVQQMTTNVEGAGITAWSPDASRVAVSLSRRIGPMQKGQASMMIFAADRPSGDQQADMIAPGPPTDGRFVPNSWSADGHALTGQTWFGIPGIYVYSLPARTFQKLADIGEWPVWLPDSRRILFVSRGREFHILDSRTRTTKRIYSVLRDTLGPPRLTRDGRYAFFSRRITESDIWMVNLQ